MIFNCYWLFIQRMSGSLFQISLGALRGFRWVVDFLWRIPPLHDSLTKETFVLEAVLSTSCESILFTVPKKCSPQNIPSEKECINPFHTGQRVGRGIRLRNGGRDVKGGKELIFRLFTYHNLFLSTLQLKTKRCRCISRSFSEVNFGSLVSSRK